MRPLSGHIVDHLCLSLPRIPQSVVHDQVSNEVTHIDSAGLVRIEYGAPGWSSMYLIFSYDFLIDQTVGPNRNPFNARVVRADMAA